MSDYTLEAGGRVLCYRGLGLGGKKLLARIQLLEKRLKTEQAKRWALEAEVGRRAEDVNPNPWNMRNPYRKNNGCWFDGTPIAKEGSR